MSEMPPEVIVIVEPPLPDISVTVEAPLPEVVVETSTEGLPGPRGPEGPPGPSDLAALNEHINADEPHPAYDDGPSLFLLYENAKV